MSLAYVFVVLDLCEAQSNLPNLCTKLTDHFVVPPREDVHNKKLNL